MICSKSVRSFALSGVVKVLLLVSCLSNESIYYAA